MVKNLILSNRYIHFINTIHVALPAGAVSFSIKTNNC